MTPPFDPYHHWLGIHKDEQPPNHYRLLGLRMGESDPNVIDNAADRVMMHLRSLSLGANGGIAERILNEVSTARLCLLSAEKRLQYDRLLQASLPSPPPGTFLTPLVIPQVRPVSPPQNRPIPIATHTFEASSRNVPPSSRSDTQTSPRRASRQGKNAFAEMAKIVLGGVVGLAIAQAVLFYTVGEDVFGIMRVIHGRQVAATSPITLPESTTPQTQKEQPRIAPAPIPRTPGSLVSPPAWTPPPSSSQTPTSLPPPSLPMPKATVPSAPPVEEVPRFDAGMAIRNLPVGVALPPLVETAPHNIVPLGNAPAPLVQLNCSWASMPEKASFVVEKVAVRHEWHIAYCPNIEAQPPTLQAVANLELKEDGLWFNWTTSPLESTIRQELSNCKLGIAFEGAKKEMALRQRKTRAPLVLDLSKPLDVQEIELDGLPPGKLLAAKFSSLNQFTSGATWKNGVSTAQLGKKAIVEFSQVPGARLEFSFVEKSKDKLAITIRPVFLEKGTGIEMTLAQLAKMEESIPNTIAEAQRSLQDAQSDLSSLASAFSSAQSRRPSSLAEVNARNVLISSIASKHQRANARIGQLGDSASFLL